MIVFNDLNIMTRSDVPDADWTGEARYVADDSSELAAKIMSCAPFFEPVEGADGELTDIIPLPRPVPSLAEEKNRAVAQTREWLRKELETRYVEWTNGKKYSITDEKQTLLSRTLLTGVLQVTGGANPEEVILPWNAAGEVHEGWKYADLCRLAGAVYAAVEPLVVRQQTAEKKISEADTYEEVQSILEGLG